MDNIFTVTSLNNYTKSLLDEDYALADVAVEGEISNFVNHYKSGHYYMALKDENAVIKAVMFSSYNRKLSFLPENGMKVIVRGRVSIYEKDGTYQIYVTDMFKSGIGLKHLALEKLKEKLFKEGLFDQKNKKNLPLYPFTVGVATSSTGAALQDIISVASRRFPCAKIVLASCGVQGDSAKESIISAIKKLDNREDVEVIIISRGGGSKEDMWVFNDEDIARCAYACKKPTVSAVGHEIDWTILDYVCDKRAATPTAAAEIVFPDIRDINFRILKYEETIDINVKGKAERLKEKLEYIKNSKGFNNVKLMCVQKTDKLEFYKKSINSAVKIKVEKNAHSLQHFADVLESNNPIQNLKKGYSLIFKDEKLLNHNEKIKKNDRISVRTYNQILNCTVDSTKTLRKKETI